jgi:uncharacterized membrane protein
MRTAAGIHRRLEGLKTLAEILLFNATLRPNPPMSGGALKLVLAVVATINLAFATWFVAHGAWPITPFMGADIVLLAWAFHASRLAARRREELRVTRSTLCLDRFPPRGSPTHLEFNSYWVRVELEEPPRSTSRLTLRSHGRVEQIGAFLPPAERRSTAQALKAAIWKARASPAD